MANKIDANMTQQYLNITGSSGRTASTDQAQARPSERPGVDTSAETRATDTVELTQSAREMQALETALGSVSEVDQARVDEVRARLESGSYEVSASRTADKMIALDRALPNGE